MLSIYSPSDLRKAERAISLLEEIIGDSPATRISKRKFLATALAVLGAACGSTPTAPSTPNPNPNPNPQQQLSIKARLENLYNQNPFEISSASVGGMPAEISGNGDGTYNLMIRGISPGLHEALLSGSGSLERKVKLNIQDKQEYSLNTIPSDFPLEFFNAVLRNNNGIYPNDPIFPDRRRLTYSDGTVRWEQKPTFYLDLESLSRLGKDMPWFLGEIRKNINTHLPYITDNLFAGSRIIEVQRSSQLPQLGTSGIVIVRGGNADGALAVHDEWIDNRNVIYSALVEFAERAGGFEIAQDMCQIAGFLRDYNATGTDSLFWNRHPYVGAPTPKDNIMGTYLYRRPAGTKSPDDTSHLDTIGTLALIMKVLSGRRNDRFAAIMPAVQNYIKNSSNYRA